jgi:hypothetical protein
MVVASGGGLHVYWILREPIDVAKVTPEGVKPLLRRLAIRVGGDLSEAEAARVLRVPGRFNCKPEYGEPREVRVEVFEPERIYDVSEFDFPLEPAATQSGPFVLPEKIPWHERNNTLFKFARSLKAKGFDEGMILAALVIANTRCVPPLDDVEVGKIAHGATTQADRPPSPTPTPRPTVRSPRGRTVLPSRPSATCSGRRFRRSNG